MYSEDTDWRLSSSPLLASLCIFTAALLSLPHFVPVSYRVTHIFSEGPSQVLIANLVYGVPSCCNQSRKTTWGGYAVSVLCNHDLLVSFLSTAPLHLFISPECSTNVQKLEILMENMSKIRTFVFRWWQFYLEHKEDMKVSKQVCMFCLYCLPNSVC